MPVTPSEIADSAIEAARAGASIVHLHVRDQQTRQQSTDFQLYKEVVDRIRASSVDVILNLTCGPGARFVPSEHDPRTGDATSTLTPPEQRVGHVVELKPELCSLDVATFSLGHAAFINMPSHLVTMARLIEGAGVTPELEIFDHGHLRLALHLLEHGMLTTSRSPPFQFCLGVPWGRQQLQNTCCSCAMRCLEKRIGRLLEYQPPSFRWLLKPRC